MVDCNVSMIGRQKRRKVAHLSPFMTTFSKRGIDLSLVHCELRELFSQTLSGVENAALHGAHGNVQFLGNFIVVEAVEKH